MALDKTIGENIYQELYRDIIQHKLKPGQQLTLTMLKKRFDVSHTPIREALTRLSADGLVSYETNKGMKVVKFSEAEIREIFLFTAELEVLAMRFCSSSFTLAPLLSEMERTINESETALKKKDMKTWESLAGKVHSLFYKYSSNRYLDEAAERMGARMELMSHIYSRKGEEKAILERQKKIFQAVKEGDFDAAADHIRAHLQFSMMDVLEDYRTNVE